MAKKKNTKDLQGIDSTKFTLWWKEPKKSPITILGMDPALKTFAWTIVQIRNRTSFNVLGSGKLKSAIILDGSVTQENLKAVVYDLAEMIKDYDIDCGATERITNRGGIGITLRCIEQINLLLGSIMLSANIPFQMIPAQVWKRVLIPEGSGRTNSFYFPNLTPDHKRDAGCIALFSYMKLVERGLVIES